MPIRELDIAVIGDEELVNALRLAGISRHYMIKDVHDAAENVRKALAALLAEPGVGVVIMLEDYTKYVEDIVSQARKKKGASAVIVEVPSKFGTKYPDTRAFYRGLIRESIGFEIEI